jgi:Negative regulator of beta-lactamase expression
MAGRFLRTYVIDRNGDIYQMVSDSDRSNHCMGANQNSIGIEHVGSETDSLMPRRLPLPQRSFAGYLNSIIFRGQTSLDTISRQATVARVERAARINSLARLHSQNTIAAWVEANV